ncbi:MAG: PqqD family protein [Tenericutes bacterium HGW-Tenericutes-1]|jgi:hypothetical protein|nr:MAG: PqqD family protein [Tenericutes bacterium HGW-Tenericutes-1]
MRLKEGYLLRKIAGQHVVVPVGEAALNLNGVITLNESGCYLWELLQNDISEEELLDKMLSRYNVSKETAALDIKAFINKMINHHLLVIHE